MDEYGRVQERFNWLVSKTMREFLPREFESPPFRRFITSAARRIPRTSVRARMSRRLSEAEVGQPRKTETPHFGVGRKSFVSEINE